MIPIVLGAFKEDYEGALPPHSYINVDDFTSIRELTDYIRYLDKNDTAYASYLAWKEHGKIYVSCKNTKGGGFFLLNLRVLLYYSVFGFQ